LDVIEKKLEMGENYTMRRFAFFNNSLTNKLTPWRRILLDKLPVSQEIRHVFMKPERSQKYASGSNPDPYESSPHIHILHFKTHFNNILPSTLLLPSDLSSSVVHHFPAAGLLCMPFFRHKIRLCQRITVTFLTPRVGLVGAPSY
jgi:hypothetical protein